MRIATTSMTSDNWLYLIDAVTDVCDYCRELTNVDCVSKQLIQADQR